MDIWNFVELIKSKHFMKLTQLGLKNEYNRLKGLAEKNMDFAQKLGHCPQGLQSVINLTIE